MKFKIFSLNTFLLITVSIAFAQEGTEVTINEQKELKKESNKLSISGSVDLYYNYNFSGQDIPNIKTYFTETQNSIAIGMANVILSQSGFAIKSWTNN
ncbi:hypothetical protein EI427_25270 [Flammeovirga pectinis]|uniref:Porin n=1 Tax=Flammeovirga pectinis TaxID=2494373 RepID=A0A3Q9FRN5_9BACT|nr:outer membrane beta-barrel protein [Flammeovirga pectinis]AZQ65526.1 hypothetical protein EI427_25270 [Flammeovirga pectinis]